MRWFHFSFVLFVACERQAAPAKVVTAENCRPLAGVSANERHVANDTSLIAEAVPPELSSASVRIDAPGPLEQLAPSAAGGYEVRVVPSGLPADSLGIDVALDAERPRRLSASPSSITLRELASTDLALSPGTHWLFAGPVLASGLVPRARAIARRFSIGKPAADAEGPGGSVWLRKPEGTYNGPKQSTRILFDAVAFSAQGEPLDADLMFTVRGPGVVGELRLPVPFVLRDVPSGDYEISVSAPSVRGAGARFTVNHELGGAP